MESLDLTYKLFDQRIKSKAPDQFYFMFQVFQEHSHCYNKRKKINKNYENLFVFVTTPSLSGRGEGYCFKLPPPTFFRAKVLKLFFIDTWVSGQRVGKLTECNLSEKAKTARGKIQSGGGGVAIDYIASKISSRLGMLRKARKVTSLSMTL